jgi:arylsulfatase A-like enzyme
MSSNSWLCRPWTEPESLHPNTWTTDAAIDLIQRRDPLRPFFLQVGYHRPHPPLDPPIAWYNKLEKIELPEVPIGDWAKDNAKPVTDPFCYDNGELPGEMLDDTRRAYFAQIMHLDDQIGRLINHCRRNGLMKNTWIVFMSDHGELLGDHHGWRKVVPWEGSAGVPLVVMPPMDGEHGALCNTIDQRPLTHADIMPTFLKIAGLAVPECVDGKDILGNESHEYIHGEHAPCWQYLTDGKEKFAWQSTTGKRWFFDLQNDPQELHNLADDPSCAKRVALWESRLIEILKTRPEDGMVQDGKLVSGTSTPAVRDFLLKK